MGKIEWAIEQALASGLNTAVSTETFSMNHSAELSPSEEMATMESDHGTIAAFVILGLSFLVGVPGNLLVIWTILRHIKQLSHTLVLILHLAVADLLVLITLPLWIYSLAHSWVFGEASCKGLVYIINVCMFSSIFFITLMSLERFIAICHPFFMMRWKAESAMNWCLVLLWLPAILLGVPVLLIQSSDGNKQCFNREFSSVTQAIIFLCLETFGGFFFPFIIICISYCLVTAQLRRMRYNTKQRSLVLVHTVVIAFILCWFPYHIINIMDLVCFLKSGSKHGCVPESFIICSGALVFINSALNPVLYVFFARNFRGKLEDSRLVRLFQEVATHANRLMELVVQQQTSQRAANIQVELMSDQFEEN